MATNEHNEGIRRRFGLAFGLAATGGVLLAKAAKATELTGKGMAKITTLYSMPSDPAAFEKHYAEVHMPMVYRTPDLLRVETGRPEPGPDGKPPPVYRITELWFGSKEALQEALAHPQWQKITADVPNFATGGATVLITVLE